MYACVASLSLTAACHVGMLHGARGGMLTCRSSTPTPPTLRVTQYRNAHKYLKDFSSELDLYLKTEGLLVVLNGLAFPPDWRFASPDAQLAGRVLALYVALYEHGLLEVCVGACMRVCVGGGGRGEMGKSCLVRRRGCARTRKVDCGRTHGLRTVHGKARDIDVPGCGTGAPGPVQAPARLISPSNGPTPVQQPPTVRRWRTS